MNLPTHKPTTSPPHKLAYYSFGVGDFLSCLGKNLLAGLIIGLTLQM